MSPRFPRDVLGAPYTAETIDLAPDDEGPVTTTLVRRRLGRRTKKAVLYVHGFADYFFQTEYADWWVERGYDFYALDLRRYGRSLLPHQTPNYTGDLHEYFDDLDAAWGRITDRDRHDHVVLTAHSTGGLITSLWADEGLDGLSAMVLNAPWLDQPGSALLRTAGTTAVKRIAGFQPKLMIPRTVNGFYTRSLHSGFDGEFDFDLDWKPIGSWPLYAGWLAAIRDGHAAVHAGLDIAAPVLVLSSSASALPSEMGPDVHTHDIVLDVEQIRRWSPALGHHVTYVAIPDARHDVFLSLADPRALAYDVLDRWRLAFVD
ncbi:MAG: alpha/beta hydrolase [Nocardioides sp.]